jgi:cytochrome c biogenesis protein
MTTNQRLWVLRFLWRQLTSMRTALILLFLLAVAAIPGSVYPQRAVNPITVALFFRAHPSLAPWLDRLSLFDVYGSPWFAAIYLLLMVSLAGCVIPRTLHYWGNLRALPPASPRNLSRLPVHVQVSSRESRPAIIERATRSLRDQRYRVSVAPDGRSLAAEKGYLGEFGNLVFHLSLLLLLVGVAQGALFGAKGNVLVVEGQGFADTLAQYDDFKPGRAFNTGSLPPFSFTLDQFDVTYQMSGSQRGAARSYDAHVTYRTTPSAPARRADISVNHPLGVDGARVFLVGNGYAPVFTVRDGTGKLVFRGAAPALPQDAAYTSTGVVKVPDARPDQLGFNVIFLPTTYVDPTTGPRSIFPAPVAPSVFLGAWTGDLGLDNGLPQSVYRLDTTTMSLVGKKSLQVGRTWTLPKGAGSIRFDGFKRWANFEISEQSGQGVVLAGALLAIAGVSLNLAVRRRRIWVRLVDDPARNGDGDGVADRDGGDGRTLVDVGGLARVEAATLADEVGRTAKALEDVGTTTDEGQENP